MAFQYAGDLPSLLIIVWSNKRLLLQYPKSVFLVCYAMAEAKRGVGDEKNDDSSYKYIEGLVKKHGLGKKLYDEMKARILLTILANVIAGISYAEPLNINFVIRQVVRLKYNL